MSHSQLENGRGKKTQTQTQTQTNKWWNFVTTPAGV